MSSNSFITGTWLGASGYKLHTLSIAPAQPIAVLTWHSGYAEHCGRYRKVFQGLAQQGIAVHSYDPLSHGQSEPKDADNKVFFKDLQQLVDDYVAYIAQVRQQYGATVPLFVGGHSMGGLVSVYTVLRDQSICQGVVLSAPALYISLNVVQQIQIGICRAVAAVMPRHRLAPQIKKEMLTNDPVALKEREEDTLCDNGHIRAATALAMLDATKVVSTVEQQFKLPVLLFSAEDDPVCDVRGSKRFHETVCSTDKILKLIPAGRHELLMHSEYGPQMTALVAEWIRERLPKGQTKL